MIYFKTIIEEGTISKAAQVLHMAQPPLSIQLKQLEEELNVQLLKRGHRKIELTSAGRLFYKRCLQMISLRDMTLHEMKETQNDILRLGITSSNGSIIEHILPYFKEYPKHSFRIHEGTTYELIDLLLTHNIDIGIVRTPFDQSQIHAIPFQTEPMVAVGKAEFLAPEMTHMKDYQHIPLLIHQRYLSLITDYCLNLQFNPWIKLSCDDCRTSLIWAKLGLGVAIIPQSALSFVQDESLITDVLDDQELQTTITFITRKHEQIDQKIQDFLQQFFSLSEILIQYNKQGS